MIISKVGSLSGAEAGASARGQHCWADCRVEWFHITSALHEKTSEIQKHKPLQPYTRDWYQQQIVWDWYTQPYYIHSYVQVSILQTQCLQVQQVCRIWLVQYIHDSLRISSSIYELEAYLRQAAQPRRGPKCSHPKVIQWSLFYAPSHQWFHCHCRFLLNTTSHPETAVLRPQTNLLSKARHTAILHSTTWEVQLPWKGERFPESLLVHPDAR